MPPFSTKSRFFHYITFRQVLLTGACCLNHLVNRAVACGKEFMSKVKCHVVDAFRFLECLQRPVVIVLPQKILIFHYGCPFFGDKDTKFFDTIN